MAEPVAVDAEEVFRLLTDTRLRFVDPSQIPTDVEDMRGTIERARANRKVHDGLLHHEWTVRADPDGTLVAVASCDVMNKVEMRPIKNAAGKMTGIEEHVTIAVEPTIYVHPDHQGRGYGSAAVSEVERLAHEFYGATLSLPKIDPSNEVARNRAKANGATRELPATIANPLELWKRPLP